MSELEKARDVIVRETKPLWTSKTFWANVIAAVAPLAWPPAAAWIAANPETYSALLGGLGILLRTVTSSPVSVAPAAPPPAPPAQ